MTAALPRQMYQRLYERMRKRQQMAARLHLKDAQHLKPKLSNHWRNRLDELDKELGFS